MKRSTTPLAPLRRSKRTRFPTLRAAPPSPTPSSTPSSPDDQNSADLDFIPPSLQPSSNSQPPVSPSSSSSPQSSPPPSPNRKATSARRQKPPKSAKRACTSLPAVNPSPIELPALATRTSFSNLDLKRFRTLLLDWYVANHRTLPWRAAPRHRPGLPPLPPSQPPTPTSPGAPYAIWISEVMSQQTRLSVVSTYFSRWIIAFPTIRALAEASMDQVNSQWAGLGYYRRARFLHEAAMDLVSNHNAQLPDSAKELRRVRGIGKYTAGAIASIAFHRAEPCVDGNIHRVYARLLPGLMKMYTPAREIDAVWDVADTIVSDVSTPGDLNQALMELGATICTPRSPRCADCPVAELCGARAEALALRVDPIEHVVQYPVKGTKRPVKVRNEAVVALVVCVDERQGKKFLVMKRDGKGLLGGLWETPNVVCGTSFHENDAGDVSQLLARVRKVMTPVKDNSVVPNLQDQDIHDAGQLTHIFSHIRQQLRVKVLYLPKGIIPELEQDATLPSAGEDGISFRWLRQEELDKAAVSTQMRKVFAIAYSKLERTEKY